MILFSPILSGEREDLMAIARSIVLKIRHRLQWTLSPSYRQIRRRLDTISSD